MGWAKDGKSFFVNSKYDVWQLWADGSRSRKITDGEADKVIHRYVRLDREEDYIDTKKPLYISLYGEWTKNYGYASAIPGKRPMRLVWKEAYVSGLTHQPGKKYPMITYIYEIRSHMVRRYAVPSQRNYYNHNVFTSQGYFVLQPDIVFDTGDPGISSTRTMEAAVEKVIEMGLVDEKRIGLIGHSWGGYQAAFAVTQTDIFAASVAGAGLTDFFSMYGMVFWSAGGAPETKHFEVGQERMIVPPWKDIEGYVRNSSVMHVEKLNTPLLFEVGDNDRNVDWRQGIELYNTARRAGKHMVLLVYANEGHGLRQDKNRIDYHRRILKWFGHYLKGEPAEKWIENGIPYLEQQRQLKNWKKK